MKEAMLWKPLEGKRVECQLCNWRCKIPEGGIGFCRVRKNIAGTLYSMVYGKAAAYNVDPIEKKPFFHFWPGSSSFSFSTVGCNFRCLHCQNYDISQATPGSIPEHDLPPERIIEISKNEGVQGISYTYTEPTIFFEYCYDTGMLAKKEGLYNTFVTNGYTTPEGIEKARDFLDASRIDLKGDEQHYLRVCGDIKLEKVLECIRNTYKAGLHTEIITLVIPDDNDNRDTVRMMADFLGGLSKGIPWHFIQFYPYYKMMDKPVTPVKTLERMHDWAMEFGMRYVYAGNVPGHRYENTYCPKCGELLIERVGMSVSRYLLGKDKRCPSCGEKIPIVGEYVRP